MSVYSAAVYARLSSDQSERKNESIETQIEIAEKFIGEQADMTLFAHYTEMKIA